MPELPEVNRRLAGALSGFDLAYPPGGAFGDAPGSGERVPDRDLLLADGTRASIYELLSGGTMAPPRLRERREGGFAETAAAGHGALCRCSTRPIRRLAPGGRGDIDPSR